MPRSVPASERDLIAKYILGNMAQRDIERETGVSRAYIRKLAKMIGHQFERNGIEVVGKTCMCTNCGILFQRSPSKIQRAELQFCDENCRKSWFKGSLHPSYKTGSTMKTWSDWVKNSGQYKAWKEAVLKKDDYRCVISGRTDNLECHHVYAKSARPDMSFEVSNGMTLNKEIHTEIHQLISKGVDYEEAVEILRKKYSKESNG